MSSRAHPDRAILHNIQALVDKAISLAEQLSEDSKRVKSAVNRNSAFIIRSLRTQIKFLAGDIRQSRIGYRRESKLHKIHDGLENYLKEVGITDPKMNKEIQDMITNICADFGITLMDFYGPRKRGIISEARATAGLAIKQFNLPIQKIEADILGINMATLRTIRSFDFKERVERAKLYMTRQPKENQDEGT